MQSNSDCNSQFDVIVVAMHICIGARAKPHCIALSSVSLL